MEYTVSEKTAGIFKKLTALPEVKNALDFIREDYDFSLKEHKDFVLCESPTFHEENRAKLYAEKLREYGLEEVSLDENFNVTGWIRAGKDAPTVMIEAHLDTVFPFGTVKSIEDNGTEMYAPGATDDTRGVTSILALLRALKHSGITPAANILFAGSTREEGMGGFGGMKDLVRNHPEIDGSISLDGASYENFTCEATGFRTYSVTFHGKGGHAFSAYGQVANALHAAARAVAKIGEFRLPEEPRTTVAVTNFHAGNDAGVHAIVNEATIKLNFRSNSQEELDRLDKRIFEAVEEACREETLRWGKDTITWDCHQYVDVPAGTEDHHLPIVESTFLAAEMFCEEGETPAIRKGGCVNGNVAIGAGIPCVTIGGGKLNCKIHSVEEYFPYKDGWKLPEEALLILLMATGVAGKTEGVIAKRA